MLLSRYPTSESYIKEFSPANQIPKWGKSFGEIIYTDDTPTLLEMVKMFSVCYMVVVALVKDWSDFMCGELSPSQIDTLARQIVYTYPHMHIGHLLHFGFLLRSGEYTNGNEWITGQMVMTALRKFNQRAVEEAHDYGETIKRNEPRETITFEEYQRRHGASQTLINFIRQNEKEPKG